MRAAFEKRGLMCSDYLFGEPSLVVPFVFVVVVVLRKISRILVPFDQSERWRCFDVDASPGQRQAEGGAQ